VVTSLRTVPGLAVERVRVAVERVRVVVTVGVEAATEVRGVVAAGVVAGARGWSRFAVREVAVEWVWRVVVRIFPVLRGRRCVVVFLRPMDVDGSMAVCGAAAWGRFPAAGAGAAAAGSGRVCHEACWARLDRAGDV
jgi:hypothetical protein